MRKRTKVLLVLAASLGAGLLLLEAGLRWLLFSELARELGIGWRARHASLYTAREAGPETWKLQALLDDGPGATRPFAQFDARFGWLKASIDPVTLAHSDEECLQGRRPVLLFGDSYAQCVGQECWQELLEQSDLAERYRLLNYGVGGYGLDQIRLLMSPVVERFAHQAPVVVIAILVDDDLDRCYLGLRNFPKPSFRVADETLVLQPLEHADARSFVRAHPLGIASYLWRCFLFGSGLVPRATALAWTGEGGHVAAKENLCRLLLRDIQGELEARGLSSFFLLFHARRALDAPGPYGWQEPFLYRTFAELGIPFVSSKRFLRAHMVRTGTPPESLYIRAGPGLNHYEPAANALVFEALRAGLEGRFEPREYLAEQ